MEPSQPLTKDPSTDLTMQSDPMNLEGFIKVLESNRATQPNVRSNGLAGLVRRIDLNTLLQLCLI